MRSGLGRRRETREKERTRGTEEKREIWRGKNLRENPEGVGETERDGNKYQLRERERLREEEIDGEDRRGWRQEEKKRE